MDACGVLRLVPNLLLKLRQVPFGEFLVDQCAHVREDVGNWFVEISNALFLLLDVVLDIIGQNFPEHRDQVIDQ